MLTDRIKITVRIFKKKTLRYDVCGKDCAIGDTVFFICLQEECVIKCILVEDCPKKEEDNEIRSKIHENPQDFQICSE